MTYTGLKAEEMLKNATETYTTTRTVSDPWWGEKTETTTHVVVNGKVYTKTSYRDGWPVLWED
jgi:hypothetical protein